VSSLSDIYSAHRLASPNWCCVLHQLMAIHVF